MSDASLLRSILPLLVAALSAGILVYAAIPTLMPLFARYALSRPNARSSHRVPTPQGGGAPVVLAVILVTLLAFLTGLAAAKEAAFRVYYMLLVASAVAMALMGAADDIRPLPALSRLAMQAVLVGLVVFGAPEDWRIVEALPMAAERAIAVVAGVWFVNLTNFMDGIDGIVVAEAVPLSATVAVLAALGIVSPLGGIVAAALAGAMLGFAPFNRHPARLFLGDVGSLPIGLFMAALMFELAARVSIAAAVLLPMYFLADATQTLLKGLANRQNVLAAHRRHAYQNAVDGGMSAPDVTRQVLGLNIGLAVLALAAIVSQTTVIDAGLVLIGLAATLLLMRRFRAAGR